MKKIFIVILLATALTACTQNKDLQINEKNAPDNLGSFNEGDVIQRLDEIKNGATPKTKPTGKKDSKIQNSQKQPSADKVKLDDLANSFNGALIKTNLGDIKVRFYTEDSPLTVNNFLNLAKKDFYNNTKFHRVIKDFMIQGGDPNSKDDNFSDDGIGGPGYKFKDEFNTHKLVRGSLAMANSGPNTNGSQFFIVTVESTPWLDGKHTNFGYVVEGMETVDKIEALPVDARKHPTKNANIESIELINIP